MEKINMVDLQSHFKCKDNYQKCILSELVFLVLSEPSNKTGYTEDRRNELRAFLYGDMLGTAEEKVLSIAGYWSNDLASVFAEITGVKDTVFEDLFTILENKEAIQGVVLPSCEF